MPERQDIPHISGSKPGMLDASQKDRLLKHPHSSLTFATFDLSALDLPELRNLSLQDDSGRPRRVVVETLPGNGPSFWRFVPKARKEEGVVDEGPWPRVVNVLGCAYCAF